MATTLTAPMPRNIDPKLTEAYLLDMIGVVDASVWWHDGDLNAHVTVMDDQLFNSKDYQRCCMLDLGLHQTPRNITIEKRHPLRIAA